MKNLLQLTSIFILLANSVFAQVVVKNIRPGSASSQPYPLAALSGNRTILYADDGTSGYEIWVTDGTTAGTKMVIDINASGGSLAYLSVAVLNDKMYFA